MAAEQSESDTISNFCMMTMLKRMKGENTREEKLWKRINFYLTIFLHTQTKYIYIYIYIYTHEHDTHRSNRFVRVK